MLASLFLFLITGNYLASSLIHILKSLLNRQSNNYKKKVYNLHNLQYLLNTYQTYLILSQ